VRLDHISTAPRRHYETPNLVLEARASKCEAAVSRMKTRLNGQCVRGPGEDSTGAGAEREWGFDPQSKAEVAQGEYKGARREEGNTGTTSTHRPAAGWPGGGAKDPTDDPAELDVLF
jgi:hypothetical protein